jgi:hypothetical protein
MEPLAPSTLQWLHCIAGREAEAEAEFERSKDLPDQYLNTLTAAVRAMGRREHDRAKALVSACMRYDATLREVLEVFDDADAARALVRGDLEASLAQGGVSNRLGGKVTFAAYFGEPELALAAWRAGARDVIGVRIMHIWTPLYASMRALPGFKDLVRDTGLLDYWRTTGEWGEFARPLGEDDFEVYR